MTLMRRSFSLSPSDGERVGVRGVLLISKAIWNMLPLRGVESDCVIQERQRFAGRAEQIIPQGMELDPFRAGLDEEFISAPVAVRVGLVDQGGAMERLVQIADQMDQPRHRDGALDGGRVRIAEDV